MVVVLFGAWGGLRLLDWLLDKLYPGDPGDVLPGDEDRMTTEQKADREEQERSW
jgi:hypothetical protein